MRFSPQEIKKAIPENELKTLKIIFFAVSMGVTIFAIIILFKYLRTPVNNNIIRQEVTKLTFLSILHVSSFIFVLFASQYIFKSRVTSMNKKIQDNLNNLNDLISEVLSSDIRVIYIITLALLEGVTFFGLVVCFLGTSNGIMNSYPYFWLNIISYCYLLYTVIHNFPTKDNLVKFLTKTIMKDIIY